MTSLYLILIPTGLFLIFEWTNPQSLGGLPFGEKFLASYFQVVVTRTAGFNTLDTGALNPGTLYMVILLMFVGGSPSGTAGGIKTTTFATMIIALWSTMRGREDATVFHRRLAPETISRAFFLAILAFLLTTGITLFILLAENKVFLNTLFEVMSAFGTVGLSMGNGGVLSYSTLFSDTGKLFIILMMFIGRVGPLTVGAALVRPRQRLRYRLPEGKCLIG
jgi:trk system potassium uptake protein TrkH